MAEIPENPPAPDLHAQFKPDYTPGPAVYGVKAAAGERAFSGTAAQQPKTENSMPVQTRLPSLSTPQKTNDGIRGWLRSNYAGPISGVGVNRQNFYRQIQSHIKPQAQSRNIFGTLLGRKPPPAAPNLTPQYTQFLNTKYTDLSKRVGVPYEETKGPDGGPVPGDVLSSNVHITRNGKRFLTLPDGEYAGQNYFQPDNPQDRRSRDLYDWGRAMPRSLVGLHERQHLLQEPPDSAAEAAAGFTPIDHISSFGITPSSAFMEPAAVMTELAHAADAAKQVTGKPVPGDMQLAPHYSMPIDEIRREAERAGVLSGKSTAQEKLNTLAGQAWLRMQMQQHADAAELEKQNSADDIFAKFTPDYTPEQLENLGVYDSIYRGKAPRLASLKAWKPEWLSEHDPMGWAQWYKRYTAGRRIPGEDERQIRRWLNFKSRHGGPFKKNPTPRRGWALRNWAIEPSNMVDGQEKNVIAEMLDEYKRKKMQQFVAQQQKQSAAPVTNPAMSFGQQFGNAVSGAANNTIQSPVGQAALRGVSHAYNNYMPQAGKNVVKKMVPHYGSPKEIEQYGMQGKWQPEPFVDQSFQHGLAINSKDELQKVTDSTNPQNSFETLSTRLQSHAPVQVTGSPLQQLGHGLSYGVMPGQTFKPGRMASLYTNMAHSYDSRNTVGPQKKFTQNLEPLPPTFSDLEKQNSEKQAVSAKLVSRALFNAVNGAHSGVIQPQRLNRFVNATARWLPKHRQHVRTELAKRNLFGPSIQPSITEKAVQPIPAAVQPAQSPLSALLGKNMPTEAEINRDAVLLSLPTNIRDTFTAHAKRLGAQQLVPPVIDMSQTAARLGDHYSPTRHVVAGNNIWRAPTLFHEIGHALDTPVRLNHGQLSGLEGAFKAWRDSPFIRHPTSDWRSVFRPNEFKGNRWLSEATRSAEVGDELMAWRRGSQMYADWLKKLSAEQRNNLLSLSQFLRARKLPLETYRINDLQGIYLPAARTAAEDFLAGFAKPVAQALPKTVASAVPKTVSFAGEKLPAALSNASWWQKLLSFIPRIKQSELNPDIQLQEHQQRIADRAATENPRMLVYHGLGSGKSLSAIAAAEAAKKLHGDNYGIVVPASLRGNFQKEIKKFTRNSDPEIMSYTGLGLGKKFQEQPDTVVMDEAHRLRNPSAASSRAAQQVAQNAKRLLLLTGSPVTNSPSDLAGLLTMLGDKNISPEEFEKRYIGYQKVSPGWFNWLRGIKPGEKPYVKNEKELRELLEGKVDFQPSKTPEGVNVNEEVVRVPLSAEQQKIQKAIRTKIPPGFLWKLDREFPLSRDELAKLNSFLTGLRQVSLSTQPFRYDKDPAKAFGQSAKLQKAMKNLQQVLNSDPRKKAIIYSNFIDSGLKPYSAALEKAKIPHGIFHGSIPVKQRLQALKDYNEGRLRALLLGPAAAEGISTKGTSLIQLLDPHWHESRSQQAKGRGLRFDSHQDLPEELKNVAVQRYISSSEDPSWLGKLIGYQRERTGDEVLEHLTADKERLNEEFRKVLRDVGTQKRPADSPA